MRWLIEKQRKLSAFLISSILLIGGLAIPCSDGKYSSFSLAITALGSVLVGAHAIQTIKAPAAK